jgi:Na+/H+ antiporter NhaC
MRKHELNAMAGDLFSGAKVSSNEVSSPSERGRVIDLILPIVFLLIASLFALVYVGGLFGADAWGYTDNVGNFIGAFGNTDATIALPWGGLISLIATIVYMICRKTISFKEAMEVVPKGFIAMVPAILILTFATALKNITGELGAAFYVGDIMQGSGNLQGFLPAVIFLVACVLAFATGTSWGTFGILIPIVTAIFGVEHNLYVVGISACLAGAVCGDHCSPISDTTIMSSAGAECEHINHVSTQIPYALFVAVVSFFCYIIAGFIPVWYVALPIAIAIMIGALIVTKIVCKKIYKEEVSSETTAE